MSPGEMIRFPRSYRDTFSSLEGKNGSVHKAENVKEKKKKKDEEMVSFLQASTFAGSGCKM